MSDLQAHTFEYKEVAGKISDRFQTLFIICILCLITILFVLGFAIKTPDIIVAETRVTSENPPITLNAQQQGKLHILVSKIPCECFEGQYIAEIENSANVNSVVAMKDFIEKCSSPHFLLNSEDCDFMEIGDLEPYYFQYKLQKNAYLSLLSDNHYLYELQLYDLKLKNDSTYIPELEQIHNNYIAEYKIKQKQYQTDSILFAKRVIIEAEANQSYLQMLYAKEKIINSNTLIYKQKQSIIDTQLQKAKLINEYTQAKNESFLKLQESYNNLVAQISKWENNYIFKAAQKGIIEYVGLITDKQYINTSEPVFCNLSANSNFYAIAAVPSAGAGAIKIGQQVNIKLDLYPFHEYGMLEGIVSEIAMNSIDKFYMVKIKLSNGLQSSNGVDFHFAQTMFGKAEIITLEKSIIHKIFYHITTILTPDKKIKND